MIMFWDDEKIFWYQVASEYTKYHKNMAEVIKSIVPFGESMIDFGCGLGKLSLELSTHFDEIVGVDYDKRVLEILSEDISKYCLKNFKIVNANCYDEKLKRVLKKTDNILFSHFGNVEEYFFRFSDYYKKRMIIIRNNEEKRIVHNPNKNTIFDICEFLDKFKIKYKIYKQTFEFGQPLRDDDEVKYYLNKWYKEKGDELIKNVENIEYTYNYEHFTKYYCKPKSTAIAVIEKEDI
ncbi:MAG: class I SAM-dependent methyltransferase [Peptoniphilaceae bacterium]|uniref:methyltransferase domain-containing protein n=1 Tax=Parvimonas sp. TaxID=1944660 RepID=UPI0025D46162|nr:class I SAM-dependent methyltransferase [Parvimonas sp.]MDD7764663.1 class I SAM-dependent methyltransferase [Peptoniphilaceae bacterium]